MVPQNMVTQSDLEFSFGSTEIRERMEKVAPFVENVDIFIAYVSRNYG